MAAGAPPETRQSSSDLLVRDLLRGLYEGRYVPGQRLVEPDLMRRYGLGRSTVREAIKRLAAEGVVTLLPFRGAAIRQLSRSEARGISQITELMIGLACRLAAERIAEPGKRERIRERLERLLAFEAEADSFEQVRARNRFYRALVEAGGNAELARLLPGVQVHLLRTQLRQPRARQFADYREMAAAVLAGDPAAAEAAGRAHIRRVGEGIESLPDEVFAPE